MKLNKYENLVMDLLLETVTPAVMAQIERSRRKKNYPHKICSLNKKVQENQSKISDNISQQTTVKVYLKKKLKIVV